MNIRAFRNSFPTVTIRGSAAKVRLILGAICVITLGCSCGSVSKGASSTSSTLFSSSSKTTGTSISRKPPLVGLIDMGYQGPYGKDQPFPPTDPSVLDSYAGAFSGIVVNESWSQLEPTEGVYDWAPLDASLANIAAWNTKHSTTPLAVKLRIFAGQSAPAWVVSMSGPEVTTTAGLHTARTVIVGRFWTAPFRQAWSTFQHAMAARYDTDPLIRAVSVSSCSSSTGEPFVVAVARKTSRAALVAAGWTVQAQESCLQGALADYSGWKLTPVTFAFNPLPTGPGSDQTFTNSIMKECTNSSANGGPVCVLGNNALSSQAPSSRGVGQTYAEIATLENGSQSQRPAVYFQTVGAPLDCQAMSVATSYHAGSVEVWPAISPRNKGFTAIPTTTLAQWNKDLIHGLPISC